MKQWIVNALAIITAIGGGMSLDITDATGCPDEKHTNAIEVEESESDGEEETFFYEEEPLYYQEADDIEVEESESDGEEETFFFEEEPLYYQ